MVRARSRALTVTSMPLKELDAPPEIAGERAVVIELTELSGLRVQEGQRVVAAAGSLVSAGTLNTNESKSAGVVARLTV